MVDKEFSDDKLYLETVDPEWDEFDDADLDQLEYIIDQHTEREIKALD